MLVVEQKIARLRVVGADYTTIDEVKREAPALAEGKVPDSERLPRSCAHSTSRIVPSRRW